MPVPPDYWRRAARFCSTTGCRTSNAKRWRQWTSEERRGLPEAWTRSATRARTGRQRVRATCACSRGRPARPAAHTGDHAEKWRGGRLVARRCAPISLRSYFRDELLRMLERAGSPTSTSRRLHRRAGDRRPRVPRLPRASLGGRPRPEPRAAPAQATATTNACGESPKRCLAVRRGRPCGGTGRRVDDADGHGWRRRPQPEPAARWTTRTPSTRAEPTVVEALLGRGLHRAARSGRRSDRQRRRRRVPRPPGPCRARRAGDGSRRPLRVPLLATPTG